MARAGLGWSAKELSAAAGVGYATVARFEVGGNIIQASQDAIRRALEKGGADFSERAGRVGVTVPK